MGGLPLLSLAGLSLAHTRVGGTAAEWPALAALRSYLATTEGADNPHSLPAMASPPAIRTNGAGSGEAPASPDDDLTTSYLWNQGNPGNTLAENSLVLGGLPATGGDWYRVAGEATVISNGNITATLSGYSHRQVIRTNAARMAWRSRGLSAPLGYRFIVDGEYVNKVKTVTPGTGREYIVLDFGSSAWRTLIIETEQNGGIEGFHIAPGDLVELPTLPTDLGGIVIGDSFTSDTGATFASDGYSAVCSDYLGLPMLWGSGAGGSGYVSDQGGTSQTLADRLTPDIERYISVWGQPALIGIAVGLNDIGLSGIEAAATAAFAAIRALAPGAAVFVVGPWDTAAPGAPVANYAACKTAIVRAVGTQDGFWFIDMEGVTYSKSDVTHPDTAGHATLGVWINDQIRAIAG